MKKLLVKFADNMLSKESMTKVRGGYGGSCGVCVSLQADPQGRKPACEPNGNGGCICWAGPSVCG